MQIDINLDRNKSISSNEPLMNLIEEVEKQIEDPKKNRTLTGFEEIVTGDGRAIKLTYSSYTLGFSQGSQTCTLFADREYHLKNIIQRR